MKKLLLTILLFCCSFSLIAQSQTKQRFISLGEAAFNEQIPYFNWWYSSACYDEYFQFYFREICRSVTPYFVPKTISNVTAYVWSTYESFGSLYKDKIIETIDATYKNGILRTSQSRGDSSISQYTFDSVQLVDLKRYNVYNGQLLSSEGYDKIDLVHITEDYYYLYNGFSIAHGDKSKLRGRVFYIEHNNEYITFKEYEWGCSKWKIITKYGADLFDLKELDTATSYYDLGYYAQQVFIDILRDKDNEIYNTTFIRKNKNINALGLCTEKSAFDCLNYGWSYISDGKTYYVTYDYE